MRPAARYISRTDTEISNAAIQRLLGVGKSKLAELVQRGVAVRGGKRGTYKLEAEGAAIAPIFATLRQREAGRLAWTCGHGSAQADLAAEKVKAMRGEVLPTVEVEVLWTSKLRAFRNRILATPRRVEYLSARQTLASTQELRAALDELAEDKSTLT